MININYIWSISVLKYMMNYEFKVTDGDGFSGPGPNPNSH